MALLDLPAEVSIHQVATPSLGDHSYVGIVGGTSFAIDPQRDIDRFTVLLGASKPSAVLETHIHNDYLTGGVVLADLLGCPYFLPAESGAEVEHRAIGDGDSVALEEGWVLRGVPTPGHTPHHTSYVLTGPDGEVVVFSGGSMLVGAVGRTDLIDPDQTEHLTREQHRSVRRLASMLGDTVVVAPTHGAGSFCATGPSAGPHSTVGEERRRNPALTLDEADFVRAQSDGFGLYPSYYEHMGPLNRRGPAPMPAPPPVIDHVEDLTGTIVDIRRADAFAEAHIPGSVSVPYSMTAATYVAWLFPLDESIVVVADHPSQATAMHTDLARIGFDQVAGVTVDGIRSWTSAGRETASLRLAPFAALPDDATILDVRDPAEAKSVIPGAVRTHLSAVDPAALPDSEAIWVHCAGGYRAMIASSLLQAAGKNVTAIAEPLEKYQGDQESV